MRYTSEDFTREADWLGDGVGKLTERRRVMLAALRIASRVMAEGGIEKSLYDQDFVAGPDVPWQAKMIREWLTKDAGT